LIHFIKDTITNYQKTKPTLFTSFADSFTDDIEILEEYVKNSFIEFEKENGNIRVIEQTVPMQTQTEMFAGDVVKLNCKVQIRYMNSGKDISVQIVSTENNKPSTNDVQKIFHKSSFAVSLLGHIVGDIVKIGSLDNFVEIMKIEN